MMHFSSTKGISFYQIRIEYKEFIFCDIHFRNQEELINI